MHRRLQLQPLSYDGHEHIRAYGDPDLALDGILRGAEERLDPQVLLDPFEEQLHLPAHLVELTDRERLEIQMVGYEHQLLAGLGVFEADAAQRFRVALLGIEHGQSDRVVADHPGAAVGLAPRESLETHASFGSGHKERSRLIESRQALEVDVAAIDDIEGASLWNELIEDVDVVKLAVADVQESRDIPAQVAQSMELYRRFGRPKRCPWKQRQAQIDGRRVERVDRIGQFDPERPVRVELARHRDEPLRKFGIDSPIAHGIGVCQRVARNLRTQSQLIELVGLGAKTRLDVAQTLPKCQLHKDHDQQLLEAGVALDLVIPFVAGHAATECCQRKMRGQLREDQLPGVQGDLGADEKSVPLCRIRCSNRDQIK